MGQVAEIWRYPFKSMVGERLGEVHVTQRGLPGDRAWACRDEVRGGIRGAKQLAPLMRLSARYPDGDIDAAPIIELPDGRTFGADDPAAAELVSAALDHEVTLWPLQPATDLDHYRRGRRVKADKYEDARATFGLDPEDPFPDFSRMPADLRQLLREFESPPGTYFDAYPLHLLSRQSLEALGRRSPGSAVDVRRFRPNVLVDVPESGEEFPELGWVGRTVRIGEAELDIIEPCARCVMVSRATAELPEDRDMQKVVVRQLSHAMGVYVHVRSAGKVAVGDRVEVLD